MPLILYVLAIKNFSKSLTTLPFQFAKTIFQIVQLSKHCNQKMQSTLFSFTKSEIKIDRLFPSTEVCLKILSCEQSTPKIIFCQSGIFHHGSESGLHRKAHVYIRIYFFILFYFFFFASFFSFFFLLFLRDSHSSIYSDSHCDSHAVLHIYRKKVIPFAQNSSFLSLQQSL